MLSKDVARGKERGSEDSHRTQRTTHTHALTAGTAASPIRGLVVNTEGGNKAATALTLNIGGMASPSRDGEAACQLCCSLLSVLFALSCAKFGDESVCGVCREAERQGSAVDGAYFAEGEDWEFCVLLRERVCLCPGGRTIGSVLYRDAEL